MLSFIRDLAVLKWIIKGSTFQSIIKFLDGTVWFNVLIKTVFLILVGIIFEACLFDLHIINFYFKFLFYVTLII